MPAMTKSEREELVKILRQRAAVSKRMAEQRSSDLMAAVEAQLAAIYKVDDGVWSDLMATANAAVRKADNELAKRCREMGIPEEFRPRLSCHWYDRGQNAAMDRRAELRKVAQQRIEANKQRAFVQIEEAELRGRMLLAKDALESAEALEFLESIPNPEVLIPEIDALKLTAAGPSAE